MEVEETTEVKDIGLLFVEMLTAKLAAVPSSGSQELDTFNVLNRILREVYTSLDLEFNPADYFSAEHFEGSATLLPVMSEEAMSVIMDNPERLEALITMSRSLESVPSELQQIERRYNTGSSRNRTDVYYNEGTLQEHVARAKMYIPESTHDDDEDDFV